VAVTIDAIVDHRQRGLPLAGGIQPELRRVCLLTVCMLTDPLGRGDLWYDAPLSASSSIANPLDRCIGVLHARCSVSDTVERHECWQRLHVAC